ncbi:hypothetical protein DOM22_09305 [Bdellovibrio sp. ZAP7]|uniref:hypothetical protein n=1 Tax=Bdellovibrio sp. ZAP7 TaxID=2231053 RepID=UPI001157361B|nr:hypothetical protein [Bdellovibrio sp. ZAP7]QDK45335.1 hypothetical protein DOM22_09305 [Bdellovibrio sp. ZAP7]
MKSFENDFYRILDLLKKRIPFAFNRFSDGELFIFQNKELILGDNLIKIGSESRGGPYKKEDHKHFDPNQHSFYRDRLMDAFIFRKDNYFKGISCRCCVGRENLNWQLKHLQESADDQFLTWANLLVNGNYPKFMAEMLPLFASYPTVFICNEKAELKNLPYVVKDFRVGYNAMINDYHKIEEIASWIGQNNITGHLFLFSASSYSKMAIHQLYDKFPLNTYIDVGTTMNAFMNMSIERVYLGDYWFEKPSPSDIYKICVW